MSPMRDPSMRRWLQALWLLVGLLLLTRLFAMAWIPLMDTTEGRYGEIGRKMLVLDDWITPWHDHGVPFWGKPPLSFWLTAGSFRLFGLNEFAARLPHFLCGVLTAVCVWNTARQRAPHEGAIAAAVLASALLFHLSSGAVMTDAALVLGTTMAGCSVWLAIASDDAAQRSRHGWLAFIGGAIGVLAKGPLALVLIGAPLFLWMLWCRRWMTVWQALPWVRGLLLLAALVLPWFILAERKTPGFIEYFIVGEHFHRFVTPGWDGDLYGNAHEEAKGTIWVYAAGAMAPWTALLPAWFLWRWGLARRGRQAQDGATWAAPKSGPWALQDHETGRLVALMALVPLVFFTASSNIIWTYVLPAMPGMAWWVGRSLGSRPMEGLRWAVVGTATAWVLLVAGLAVAEKIGRFERGSARTMVASCEAQKRERRSDAEPVVVVVGRRSLSADYYSAGRSPRVSGLEPLVPNWPEAGQCVALFDHDFGRIAQAGLTVERDLGRMHQRRVLWVKVDPAAANAAGQEAGR